MLGRRTGEMSGVAGLSALQRTILIWLGEREAEIGQHGSDSQRSSLRFWGVRWRPSVGQETWTASQRAVLSRAT